MFRVLLDGFDHQIEFVRAELQALGLGFAIQASRRSTGLVMQVPVLG